MPDVGSKLLKIPLFKPFISVNHSLEMINDVLLSGYIGEGEKVLEFESLLNTFLFPLSNSQNVAVVNSGTSALHLIIDSLERIEGKTEILSTTLTCVATNSSIIKNNYNIKWYDLDKKTIMPDYEDIAEQLSEKTRAIMVVHWGGMSVDLEKLKQIQHICLLKYGFKPDIIEDCAHSFGTTFQDCRDDSFYQAYSFQAVKTLTCGDGGAISNTNESYIKKIKLMRWYGLDRNISRTSQDIVNCGFKFHMNNISAVIGMCNLSHVPQLIQSQRDNTNYYNSNLKVDHQCNTNFNKSSCWLYTLVVDERDLLIEKLNKFNIESSQVHLRNDLYSCFPSVQRSLPGVDYLSDRILCIPCGWWLSDYYLQLITKVVNEDLQC